VEEIVALLLQLFLEIGLQLFGGLGFDAATETTRRKRGKHGETVDEDGCGWLLLFALVGGACGGISLLLAPNLLLPNVGLRVANLVLAPLIAGGVSYVFATFFYAPRGQSASHHFWRGFCFALLFGIVRFAFGKR
jgi:hypothetical protein